jgi:hypothetical protein
VDFAHQMRSLAEEHYPQAENIRVILDNLNTHTPASLYKAFEPQEARRLLRRLEFHHTPKHASWLNQIEIELSVLIGQCLGGRRIPDEETLGREVGAWERERNDREATVGWRFTEGFLPSRGRLGDPGPFRRGIETDTAVRRGDLAHR